MPSAQSTNSRRRPTGTIEWLRSQVTARRLRVDPGVPAILSTSIELEHLRRRIRDELDGIAVTAGFGPRFLALDRSASQGWPEHDRFGAAWCRPEPTAELPVPGQPYDFGTLINAQSIGDYESLQTHGRRVRSRVAVYQPQTRSR